MIVSWRKKYYHCKYSIFLVSVSLTLKSEVLDDFTFVLTLQIITFNKSNIFDTISSNFVYDYNVSFNFTLR